MNHSTLEQPVTPPTGRWLAWWLGLGLPFLAIFGAMMQMSLDILITPWYAPILATLGCLLMFWSLLGRRSIWGIFGVVPVAGLAGMLWFLLSLGSLASYQGPDRIPSFQTQWADGSPFTDSDLKNGQTHALVFFRGRW
jgi:hypothetical protein